MPVVVTRRETFTAGHRLFRPEWSDERNLEVFGRCSNPSGHGHNYVLEVGVRGEVDPETGYVIDLGELSRILHEAVLDDIDHRNLNTDVHWLAGRIPTTETLVDAIWERLDERIPGGRLCRVAVRETEKNAAERTRDGAGG
ncbi:MAG TPA: 6-carboxytetrahydropterin synthase [Actinomycetota bacterium]|jgi:6-pyruvoyltetrahydropterin/6-carboxytetrahydropterin synthase